MSIPCRITASLYIQESNPTISNMKKPGRNDLDFSWLGLMDVFQEDLTLGFFRYESTLNTI